MTKYILSLKTRVFDQRGQHRFRILHTVQKNLKICNTWETFCDGFSLVEDNDVYQMTYLR